jgi:hypothetical protein
MKLVRAIVELRFSGNLRLLKTYEELYVAITGQEPKGELRPTPAFGLEAKEKQLRVSMEAKRCWVDLEDIPNLGYCVQTVSGIFKKIDELIGVPLIARVGVRSMRVEPWGEHFHELVARYKRIMLANSALVERAEDLGVTLTLKEDDCKITLTTGPMELTQLKQQFLSFEPGDLPSTFIFIDIDYATVTETKYSPRFLSDFIERALSYTEQQSREVVDILRS